MRRLIVFADDWGRHPSSCQHLVRELLDDCEVTWINTIGMRPLRWDGQTVRRGWEKIGQWAKRTERVPESSRGPHVLNPRMWPSFRGGWQRWLNRRLLARFLRRHVAGLEDCIVLSMLPIVADLVGAVPVRRWVYYCVDDFSTWPGLDGGTLRDMERALVERVDRIVAAGENLASGLRESGRETVLVTHGIDLKLWARAHQPQPELPQFVGLPRPRILFWGLIDRRLDVGWLQALSNSLGEGSIVLAGPQQNPDPALQRVLRLHSVGPLPLERLPVAAANSDVLIMPYADLPVTRAMQPLKLKEYLATGKPVVVRRLPAVEPWQDCLDAVDDAGQFVQAVHSRLKTGSTEDQCTARQRLEHESWQEKAKTLARVLFDD
jgi:glycosyltransferase involved in cell wall biosynthesis